MLCRIKGIIFLFIFFTFSFFLATTVSASEAEIKILPSLSQPSVKNGDKLTISALITSTNPIFSVQATIAKNDKDAKPLETVSLYDVPGSGSTQNAAFYQANWTAHDLEETSYRIVITVQDNQGNEKTDDSLTFTDPTLGNTSVGSTSYPSSGLRRIGALSLLSSSENGARSAVIDTSGGFAYFGMNTLPGVVVKIRLSDFTWVNQLVLNSGENRLRSAVIDTTNGFAYFGTYTSPGIVVKIQLSDFTRVSGLTLETGEDGLYSAVIDTSGGFAYFGTYTSPGIVVKVQLSDFTRVGALNLDAGELNPQSAVIDPSGGFIYWGTDRSPAQIIKIQLSDFTRVSGLTLHVAEDNIQNTDCRY